MEGTDTTFEVRPPEVILPRSGQRQLPDGV